MSICALCSLGLRKDSAKVTTLLLGKIRRGWYFHNCARNKRDFCLRIMTLEVGLQQRVGNRLALQPNNQSKTILLLWSVWFIKCTQNEESHRTGGSARNHFPPHCRPVQWLKKSHHGWAERQSACWHWCLMLLMCVCKSPSLDTRAVKSPSGRWWAQSAGALSFHNKMWCHTLTHTQKHTHTHTPPPPGTASPLGPSWATPHWILWHIQLHKINDATEKTLLFSKSSQCMIIARTPYHEPGCEQGSDLQYLLITKYNLKQRIRHRKSFAGKNLN